MVPAMPTKNFTLRFLQRTPTAVIAAVFLLLSSATVTRAALQDAPADSWSSTIFSTYGMTIVLLLVLIGLIVYKRITRTKGKDEFPSLPSGKRQPAETNYLMPVGAAPIEPTMLAERGAHEMEGVQVWERPAEAEPSIYGAYRIDQEVMKLVSGKAHHMDVMASRARDDRRAIETSLIKILESPDTSLDSRRRARQALEEYGFVARQSATMLLGRDAWERSSAARALGQIGAPSSLSFLIEALHDSDPVVRNQAVASLGSLKMPAAIGALLDIARRHPDIPASLLSECLSECSVESLGYLDAPLTEPALLSSGMSGHDGGRTESFLSFEDLPEGAEDRELSDALERLASPDERTRASAVQELSLHPAQRSVSALASVVLNDTDPSVRSAAVSAMGSIDHESVLGPVLIALADESRIVRAAAARTLTGLHFDRADAYVRVMETAEPAMLTQVARACIKTGIAAQAIDRLASEDRHQAYEAFSLSSLLARANEFATILEAIQNHRDEEVRLCAVRVLNVAGQASLVPKLRELVAHEGLSENVRTALLEVLYKLDQEEPLMDFSPSDNEPATLHNSQ